MGPQFTEYTRPPALAVAKSPGLRAAADLMQKLEIERAEGHPETLRRWETEKEASQVSRDLWRNEVKTAGEKGFPPPEMPPAAVEPERPVRPRLTVPSRLMGTSKIDALR